MQVVTGNDLKTGVVVYLKADGGWTTTLAESRVFADEAEAKAVLAQSEATTARHVVAPYLIDVVEDNGVLRPARFRESIRANGPTVPSDFTASSSTRG